jgi:Leucine-rich repeat (LRR) protein
MNNVNRIRLPSNVKPFSKTKLEANEKPEILPSLHDYVRSYILEKVYRLGFMDDVISRNDFINECGKACKLAIKIIQEAKNHAGTVYFTNTEYYGRLQNEAAIRLCHILIGEASAEEIAEYSYTFQRGSATEILDKLCKHNNTILSDRKISFWGTNYTAHAEKFRQFIDNELKDAVIKGAIIIKLDAWIREAPAGEKQARLTAKTEILKTYDKKNFNAEGLLKEFKNRENRRLALTQLNLTELPIEVLREFTWLEELNLYGNQLTEYPQEILKELTQLKGLSLAKNRISELPEGALANLINLDTVNLSENQLSELPQELFKGLTRLKYLCLSENQLSEIPQGAFDRSTNLEKIDLSEIQLSKLPQGIFANSPKLKEINLSKNQLNELPQGIFANLPNLREINLSESQLSELPEGAFDSLTNLEKIDLSGNQLNELPQGIFANSPKLREINLSGSQLSKLPQGIFANLPNLREINLFGNQLSELPQELFQGLISLRIVYLARNQINDFPQGIFANLPNLDVLDLSGNPLNELPQGIFNGLINLGGGSTLKLITTHKQWMREERNIEFYRHTVNNLFHEFSRLFFYLNELNQLLINHGDMIDEDVILALYLQTDSISIVQIIIGYVQGPGQHRHINLPLRDDITVYGQPLAGIAFEVHNFTDGIEDVALNAIDEFLKVLKVSKPSFTIDNLRNSFGLIEDVGMRARASNALDKILESDNYRARLVAALPTITTFLDLDHSNWKPDYQTRAVRWSMWLEQSFVEAGTAYTSEVDSTSCVKGIYERLFTGFRGMHPLMDCLFASQTAATEFDANISFWLGNIQRANKLIAKLKAQGFSGKETNLDETIRNWYFKAIKKELISLIDNSLSDYLNKLTEFYSLRSYLAEVVNGRKEQVIKDALRKFKDNLSYLNYVSVDGGQQELDEYIKSKLVA